MSQIRDLETYSKILKFCPYILTLDCQMLITLDIAFKSKKKNKTKQHFGHRKQMEGVVSGALKSRTLAKFMDTYHLLFFPLNRLYYQILL